MAVTMSPSYRRGQNSYYPLVNVNERKTHNGHRNNLNLTKVIINKNSDDQKKKSEF